jgi:hypothetical protein
MQRFERIESVALSSDFSIRRKFVEKLSRVDENCSTVCESEGRIPPVYHPQVIRTRLAVVRRRLRPGDSDVMFRMSSSARCFSFLRCLAVVLLAATVATAPVLRSEFASDDDASIGQTSGCRFVGAVHDSGSSTGGCIRSTSIGAGDLARCDRQFPDSEVASPTMAGVETTRRRMFGSSGKSGLLVAKGGHAGLHWGGHDTFLRAEFPACPRVCCITRLAFGATSIGQRSTTLAE